MSDGFELVRQQWFSPAFPLGGYAYSHGIEAAIATGAILSPEGLANWIEDLIAAGSGWNDALFLAEAHRAAAGPTEAASARLADLSDHALAMGITRERRLESAQQGQAFRALLAAMGQTEPALPEGECAFPVAVGWVGGRQGQSLEPLIAGFLQNFAQNLFAAGLRLAIIGQTEAQVRLGGLRPVIARVAGQAAQLGLDALGTSSVRADLAALAHETLETRLFRS